MDPGTAHAVGALVAVCLAAAAGAPAQQCLPGEVVAHQKLSDTEGGFTGGLQDRDLFGTAIAPLGDLDGDGVGDVAVGAMGGDAVWILFMAADGTVKDQRVILGAGLFGRSLAALGDLDGDGVGDLAVGAPQDDDGGTDRGAVWVLFLDRDGSVRAQQKISATQGGFQGTLDDEDYFGVSVARLGDLDGDGVTELAVGAYRDDDGGSNVGALWILFLGTDGTVGAQQKISATQGGLLADLDDADWFGYAATGPGDVDGDGIPDVITSAPQDDDGAVVGNTGAVWLLRLEADGSVRSHSKISAQRGGFGGPLDDGDLFGAAVAALGDLDGDGLGDIAVGARGDGAGTGSLWVLFLAADASVLRHRKIGTGKGGFTGALDPGVNFGWAAAALGDHDGDGVRDLAVGSPLDDDGGIQRGSVWMLFLDAAVWEDLGGGLAGVHGVPALVGQGTLVAGDPISLALDGARENAPAALIVGLAAVHAPFKGGTLVPAPDILVLGLATSGAGTLQLATSWPAGVPCDLQTFHQVWIVDPAGPAGLAASNGIRLRAP